MSRNTQERYIASILILTCCFDMDEDMDSKHYQKLSVMNTLVFFPKTPRAGTFRPVTESDCNYTSNPLWERRSPKIYLVNLHVWALWRWCRWDGDASALLNPFAYGSMGWKFNARSPIEQDVFSTSDILLRCESELPRFSYYIASRPRIENFQTLDIHRIFWTLGTPN